jgi:hypothetical protein
VLLAYYVAGLLIAPYAAVFERHYTSPRESFSKALRRVRWRWAPVAAAFWPAGVYFCARDVRRYGWRGL